LRSEVDAYLVEAARVAGEGLGIAFATQLAKVLDTYRIFHILEL